MFAIIETLGRQYKVQTGDRIKVDRIADSKNAGDAPEGTKITFNQVLFLGASTEAEAAKVGTPFLMGAKVLGKIVEQGLEKKGVAFKKKRRKGYTRKIGYRRAFTVIEIDQILAA